jgi:hypothetical protein
VYSEQVYGIRPEQVVGTAGGTKYGYDKSGKPFLTKESKLLLYGPIEPWFNRRWRPGDMEPQS